MIEHGYTGDKSKLGQTEIIKERSRSDEWDSHERHFKKRYRYYKRTYGRFVSIKGFIAWVQEEVQPKTQSDYSGICKCGFKRTTYKYILKTSEIFNAPV